eukprot:3632628-Amphidinium_carterae.1
MVQEMYKKGWKIDACYGFVTVGNVERSARTSGTVFCQVFPLTVCIPWRNEKLRILDMRLSRHSFCHAATLKVLCMFVLLFLPWSCARVISDSYSSSPPSAAGGARGTAGAAWVFIPDTSAKRSTHIVHEKPWNSNWTSQELVWGIRSLS